MRPAVDRPKMKTMRINVCFRSASSAKMTLASVMLLCLLSSVPVSSTVYDNEVGLINDRPIIGILSQELPSTSRPEWKKYKSFISASYVKFVEGAGARVVPIWINRTKSYYEDILSRVNGVLFPGGSTSFDTKFGFADAGAFIYDIAKDLNSKGDYFPLWGTCQGFELLAYLGANRTNPLTNCSPGKINFNLEFLSDYKISKLFGSAPDEIIQILANKPVTANFHRFCLTQANLTRFMGDINWRVLSLNEDSKGLTFISSMESRSLPAYGVQFHPEKSIYEWLPAQKTAHTVSAVKAAQYFANFFVGEARKNLHSFQSQENEKKALIYNFTPTYTGLEKVAYNEQLYLFEW